MSCIRSLAAAALALALTAPAATAAVTVDPATRTVQTPRFTATFDLTNPEQLTSLTWTGTGADDLAVDGGASGCGDPLRFFGESYADPVPFARLVGPGSRGTWTDTGGGAVQIESQITADGCNTDQGLQPVKTTYQFLGGDQDQFMVTRRFAFSEDAPAVFAQGHLRPYVARLPRSPYSHTLWPSDTGVDDTLATGCVLGYCAKPNWQGTWFAQNDAETGRGLVVVRAPSENTVRLLIDNANGSLSNNSATDLYPVGFDAPVSETEYLCFYTPATWPAAERDAGKAPAWCGPSLSIAGATVNESAGTATLTVTRTLPSGPAPTFAVQATDGTAKAGADYGTPTVTGFAADAATTKVTVPIVDDGVHEADKTFTVSLTDVSGATVGGATATVTVIDDDPAPAPATTPVADTSGASVVKPAVVAPKLPLLSSSRFLTLAGARSCTARRAAALRIALRQPKDYRIAHTVVKIDNKVVKTVHGTAPVMLGKLPKGKFTLTVTVVTTNGRKAVATRTYPACAR